MTIGRLYFDLQGFSYTRKNDVMLIWAIATPWNQHPTNLANFKFAGFAFYWWGWR